MKISRLSSFQNRSFSSLNKTQLVYRLPQSVVSTYDPHINPQNQVNFGFNGVGELAYKRSYARIREDKDGRQEMWHETVERVVNGAFTMLMRHTIQNNLKWDEEYQQQKAIKMYQKILNFKFLPPGRGLWAMGTKITEEKGLYAALNNCAFVSTKQESIDKFIESFTFLMDSSMMGVGVGFDTKGSQSQFQIYTPNSSSKSTYTVADTREGWVESLKVLLESFFKPGKQAIEFDYSQIRPAGVPLKTFGGTSSGAQPLVHMHSLIQQILQKRVNSNIIPRDIVDIMNIIGRCVVAGNIRRVAEIALGEANDESFIHLKDYNKHPDRAEFGWVSNNSILAELGMDYTQIQESILKNGEPGLCWLQNMRAYGRMVEQPNYKDIKAGGGNPCLEQTLESYEMCCLVETFPHNHKDLDEFKETLELAFLYAKIVTLGLPEWDETAKVMARNRRIGCSISGIAQFIAQKGIKPLVDWCDGGYKYLKKYDAYLSKQLNVPESIKITSIKPSGTVSLLAGATPGVHFPLSSNYIRRVRLGKTSHLLEHLRDAGYHIEDDQMDPNHSVVVEIPVSLGDNIRTLKDVTLWEQLQLASLMQRYWADNQVSCTVTFDPKTEGHMIKHALDYFQFQLKGISFLPVMKDVYPQMPYEEISKEQYNQKMSNIKHLNLESKDIMLKVVEEQNDPEPENYCDADKCKI